MVSVRRENAEGQVGFLIVFNNNQLFLGQPSLSVAKTPKMEAKASNADT